MTFVMISKALATVVVAALIAAVLERLILHFVRRADEETARLKLAREGLQKLEDMLDRLVANEKLSPATKHLLIDFAEATTDHRAAKAMIDLVHGGASPQMRPAAAARFEEAVQELEDLKKADPAAYDLFRTFIFQVPITAILQWHDTYKALGALTLRLCSEREPAAVRDAYVMKQSAAMPNGGGLPQAA